MLFLQYLPYHKGRCKKLSWSEIALICETTLLIVLLIYFLIHKFKKKNDVIADQNEEIEIVNGVRYKKTADEQNQNLALKKGDQILKRGKQYKVGEGLDILAGTYTLLVADGDVASVNIKIGGLVKEFKHGSTLILAEGDNLEPLSSNIVLR